MTRLTRETRCPECGATMPNHFGEMECPNCKSVWKHNMIANIPIGMIKVK